VVLVGVVVLDLEELPLGVLLAKEGASMANHFLIEMLLAEDKDLHIVFGRNHVIKDEFLEMDKRVFAFELEGGFLNREDLAILDEEVSERCD
jgi:hypothetical protein